MAVSKQIGHSFIHRTRYNVIERRETIADATSDDVDEILYYNKNEKVFVHRCTFLVICVTPCAKSKSLAARHSISFHKQTNSTAQVCVRHSLHALNCVEHDWLSLGTIRAPAQWRHSGGNSGHIFKPGESLPI